MGSKLKYFINFTCVNGQKMTAYFSVFCESAKFCFWKKFEFSNKNWVTSPVCKTSKMEFFCSDGIMSRGQNILMGWLIPMIIVMFNLCFEYDNYGGEYHCWLQMNTSLIYGQFVPIAFLTITSLAIIGNVQLWFTSWQFCTLDGVLKITKKTPNIT